MNFLDRRTFSIFGSLDKLLFYPGHECFPAQDALTDDLLSDLSPLPDLGQKGLLIRTPGCIGVCPVLAEDQDITDKGLSLSLAQITGQAAPVVLEEVFDLLLPGCLFPGLDPDGV